MIKQVIAGADETKAVGVVDTNLATIEKQMTIGKIPDSRDVVEDIGIKQLNLILQSLRKVEIILFF